MRLRRHAAAPYCRSIELDDAWISLMGRALRCPVAIRRSAGSRFRSRGESLANCARISTPRARQSVSDAMYPRRESSAATKYSPAIPAERPAVCVERAYLKGGFNSRRLHQLSGFVVSSLRLRGC